MQTCQTITPQRLFRSLPSLPPYCSPARFKHTCSSNDRFARSDAVAFRLRAVCLAVSGRLRSIPLAPHIPRNSSETSQRRNGESQGDRNPRVFQPVDSLKMSLPLGSLFASWILWWNRAMSTSNVISVVVRPGFSR